MELLDRYFYKVQAILLMIELKRDGSVANRFVIYEGVKAGPALVTMFLFNKNIRIDACPKLNLLGV
ncbi:hypothetical protein ACLOJK_028208 [Asimina triloba]